MVSQPFWETKHLLDFNAEEWEAVCDGCAKCCLMQLQDEDTDERVFTNVACNLLNEQDWCCTQYQERSTLVPTCMTMDASNVQQCVDFAPSTCAYKLLLAGQPLPDWHHLVCGDQNEIHRQGQSIKSKFIYESAVQEDELEDFVIDWVK